MCLGQGGALPDLDLRYSILCQAALAAPLLLWGADAPDARSSCEAAPDGGQRPAAAQHPGARARGSVPADSAGASGMAGGPDVQGLRLSTEGGGRGGAAGVAERRSGCDEQESALRTASGGVGNGGGNVSNSGGGVSSGGGGASVAERGDDAAAHNAARSLGRILFVGNDWPCAPLMLRLQHCVRAGASSGCGCTPDLAHFRSVLGAALRDARAAFCIHNLAYQVGAPPGECRPPPGAVRVPVTPG